MFLKVNKGKVPKIINTPEFFKYIFIDQKFGFIALMDLQNNSVENLVSK